MSAVVVARVAMVWGTSGFLVSA